MDQATKQAIEECRARLHRAAELLSEAVDTSDLLTGSPPRDVGGPTPLQPLSVALGLKWGRRPTVAEGERKIAYQERLYEHLKRTGRLPEQHRLPDVPDTTPDWAQDMSCTPAGSPPNWPRDDFLEQPFATRPLWDTSPEQPPVQQYPVAQAPVAQCPVAQHPMQQSATLDLLTGSPPKEVNTILNTIDTLVGEVVAVVEDLNSSVASSAGSLGIMQGMDDSLLRRQQSEADSSGSSLGVLPDDVYGDQYGAQGGFSDRQICPPQGRQVISPPQKFREADADSSGSSLGVLPDDFYGDQRGPQGGFSDRQFSPPQGRQVFSPPQTFRQSDADSSGSSLGVLPDDFYGDQYGAQGGFSDRQICPPQGRQVLSPLQTSGEDSSLGVLSDDQISGFQPGAQADFTEFLAVPDRQTYPPQGQQRVSPPRVQKAPIPISTDIRPQERLNRRTTVVSETTIAVGAPPAAPMQPAYLEAIPGPSRAVTDPQYDPMRPIPTNRIWRIPDPTSSPSSSSPSPPPPPRRRPINTQRRPCPVSRPQVIRLPTARPQAPSSSDSSYTTVSGTPSPQRDSSPELQPPSTDVIQPHLCPPTTDLTPTQSVSFTTSRETPTGRKTVTFSEHVSTRMIPARSPTDDEKMARFGTVYRPPRTASCYRPPPSPQPEVQPQRSPRPVYTEPVQGPSGPWTYGSSRPPPKTAAGRLPSELVPAPRPQFRSTSEERPAASYPHTRSLSAPGSSRVARPRSAQNAPSPSRPTTPVQTRQVCPPAATAVHSSTPTGIPRIPARPPTARPTQTRPRTGTGIPCTPRPASAGTRQVCPPSGPTAHASTPTGIPRSRMAYQGTPTASPAQTGAGTSQLRQPTRIPRSGGTPGSRTPTTRIPDPTRSEMYPAESYDIERRVEAIDNRIRKIELEVFSPEECPYPETISPEIRDRFMDSFGRIRQSIGRLQELIDRRSPQGHCVEEPPHYSI